MSLLRFSQFALIRSNQGDGAAAGTCGEIRLPLALAQWELGRLRSPEGSPNLSWPRCSFLKSLIKAETAG